MSITKKTVAAMTCIFLSALGAVYLLGVAFFQTHLKIGSVINGFHCSFKSVDETTALLTREADSYALAVNTRNGGVEEITAEDAGLTFHGRGEIVDVINEQDCYLWFLPETKPVVLPKESYQINEDELMKSISELDCMNEIVRGKTASIVNNNGVYQVSPGVRGTDIDKALVYDVIEDAVLQWKESVDLEESGCYIDVEKADEEALQKQCDFLNSIQDIIITYDFGDRKETVTMDTVEAELLDGDYMLTPASVRGYVESLAEKYDTVGAERRFVTYDDLSILVSGGDYGWQMDIDGTAEALVDLISANTIDVVRPVYLQQAASRNQNDIGYSYLEVSAWSGDIVLYIEGTPVVQTKAEIASDVENGFWKPRVENGEIAFGNGCRVCGSQNTAEAGGSIGTVAITDQAALDQILAQMQESWPVIVYR